MFGVSKLCVLVQTDQYLDISNEFTEVKVPCNKKCRLQDKGEHHIDTRCDRPVFARPPRLSSDKLSLTKDEFQKLLEMNSIRHSDSAWSSPYVAHGSEAIWRVASLWRSQNSKFRCPRMTATRCLTCRISRFIWKGKLFSPKST